LQQQVAVVEISSMEVAVAPVAVLDKMVVADVGRTAAVAVVDNVAVAVGILVVVGAVCNFCCYCAGLLV
jgi:hypothetical protein